MILTKQGLASVRSKSILKCLESRLLTLWTRCTVTSVALKSLITSMDVQSVETRPSPHLEIAAGAKQLTRVVDPNFRASAESMYEKYVYRKKVRRVLIAVVTLLKP